MSRYIKADAWWEEVQKLYTDGDCADEDRYKVGINVGITASRAVMFHIPHIDIVRCKECKREDTYDCAMYEAGLMTKPDDFCSYGERSE